MVKVAQAAPRAPSSYEQLGQRIHKIFTSPQAQKAREITIVKAPGEREEDWDQLMSDIDENESVKISRLGSERAKITWQSLHE